MIGLHQLVNKSLRLFNEIDSAGDKIHAISKITREKTLHKKCLMYLWNFEIWGSFKEAEMK